METTAPAPVATAPAPAASPANSGSSLSANNIMVTLFTGIITGVAIGLGLILTQKLTKKSIIVETKGDVSAANGQPMYPPRNMPQRPPMRPMYQPQGYGYNPNFMQFNGVQPFNADQWLKSSGQPQRLDEILATAKD